MTQQQPQPIRLEYVETKISGLVINEIHPDRTVRQFGVLWTQPANGDKKC